MLKRVVIASLWFYIGWTIGQMGVEYFAVSPLLGPAIGAVLAFVAIGGVRWLVSRSGLAKESSAPIAEGHAEPS